MLDQVANGGTVCNRLGNVAHGIVWARRLRQGSYDAPDIVPETLLFHDIDITDRIALDIGAHAGSWTKVLSRRVGPGGKVLAYEAFPHYGHALSIALRLAGIRNARVRKVAVGASDGDVDLCWKSERGDFLGGLIHIAPNARSASDSLKVQMVSIDQDLMSNGLQPKDIGFVKIDVEGAELEVLRGASNLLSDGKPPVFLEAEPQRNSGMGHSIRDVFKEMANHGYRPFLVSPSGVESTDVDSYLAQYELHRNDAPLAVYYNNVLFLPAQPAQLAK